MSLASQSESVHAPFNTAEVGDYFAFLLVDRAVMGL